MCAASVLWVSRRIMHAERERCGYTDVANPFSILLLGWPAVLISDDIYSISNYGCSDKTSAHTHTHTPDLTCQQNAFKLSTAVKLNQLLPNLAKRMLRSRAVH